MFGKGGLAGDRLHHMPTAFFVVLRIPLRTDLFVITLVPILFHTAQSIKVLVSQTELAGPLLFMLLGRGALHRLNGRRFDFFEQRIRRHFVGDFPQQLGGRDLQNTQGLTELGRQDEPLHLLLRLIDTLIGH